MKRKRMTREGWGFQRFPYYQMRLDREDFHGLVCLNRLISGHPCYWHMPRAGKVAVAGEGMIWLTLVPDGAHHILTCKISPQGRINVWYADIIDRIEYDPDGVAAFVDMYLDVIFSLRGDMREDDREELDAALKYGDVTGEQYELALHESEVVQRKYGRHVMDTERWCLKLLRTAMSRLDAPDTLRLNA